LVVGGINWGLVGIFNINLVAMIFGGGTATSRVIYIIIGMAAIYITYRGLKRHL